MLKIKLPDWEYKVNGQWKQITALGDTPEDAYGFIYCLYFDDETRYIGKKALFSEKWVKMRKNGEPRPTLWHCIRNKNVNGHRVPYELVVTQSKWLYYCGSGHLYDPSTIIRREILYFAKSKLELTYYEAKALFEHDVLHNGSFHNDNILGKFYRGRL